MLWVWSDGPDLPELTSILLGAYALCFIDREETQLVLRSRRWKRH